MSLPCAQQIKFNKVGRNLIETAGTPSRGAEHYRHRTSWINNRGNTPTTPSAYVPSHKKLCSTANMRPCYQHGSRKRDAFHLHGGPFLVNTGDSHPWMRKLGPNRSCPYAKPLIPHSMLTLSTGNAVAGLQDTLLVYASKLVSICRRTGCTEGPPPAAASRAATCPRQHAPRVPSPACDCDESRQSPAPRA